MLYVRISQRRLATKIGVGSGGDAELEQRVRAHGNLVESAPFALILLYLIEQTGLNLLMRRECRPRLADRLVGSTARSGRCFCFS